MPTKTHFLLLVVICFDCLALFSISYAKVIRSENEVRDEHFDFMTMV